MHPVCCSLCVGSHPLPVEEVKKCHFKLLHVVQKTLDPVNVAVRPVTSFDPGELVVSTDCGLCVSPHGALIISWTPANRRTRMSSHKFWIFAGGEATTRSRMIKVICAQPPDSAVDDGKPRRWSDLSSCVCHHSFCCATSPAFSLSDCNVRESSTHLWLIQPRWFIQGPRHSSSSLSCPLAGRCVFPAQRSALVILSKHC